ncbi:MAG: hypothetical protein ACOCVS_02940 [Planctomycetota bacterium]
MNERSPATAPDRKPSTGIGRRLFGYILLGGMLALLGYGIHGTARAWRYDNRAMRTQGELIDFAWDQDAQGERIHQRPSALSDKGYLSYRFTVPTADGGQRTVVVEDQQVHFGPLYDDRVGEPIEVRYFPDDPAATALVEVDRTGEEILVWFTVGVVALGIVLLCIRLSGERRPESEAIPGGRRFRFSPFLVWSGRMMILSLVVFFLLFAIVGLVAGDHGFIAVSVIVPMPFWAMAGYLLLRHAGTLSITAQGIERRRRGWSRRLTWDQIAAIERDHHLPANVILRSPQGDLHFSLATSAMPYFHQMAAKHLRPEACHAALARLLARRGITPELPLTLYAPALRRKAGLLLPPLLCAAVAAAIAWGAGVGPTAGAVASGIAVLVGVALAWVAYAGGDAVRELHCLPDRIRIHRARTGMREIPLADLQGIALGLDPIRLGIGMFPLGELTATGIGTVPLRLLRVDGEDEVLTANEVRALGLRSEQLAVLLNDCYGERLRTASSG